MTCTPAGMLPLGRDWLILRRIAAKFNEIRCEKSGPNARFFHLQWTGNTYKEAYVQAMDGQKVHYIRVGPSLASAAMRSAKDGLFGS